MKRKYIKFLLLICIMLITGCQNNNSNNIENINKDDNNISNVEVNNNQNVIKNQNIDGILITNISIIYEDGISYFKAALTNDTGNDYELNEYKIIVKDLYGNIIGIIPGYVGSVLKNGESKIINASISENLSGATSIEYEIVK